MMMIQRCDRVHGTCIRGGSSGRLSVPPSLRPYVPFSDFISSLTVVGRSVHYEVEGNINTKFESFAM